MASRRAGATVTIQQNIATAKDARKRLADHHMAAKVDETESHIMVTYPPGFFPDAVRVTKANGIVWAVDQALIRMDRAWGGK